MMGTPPDIFIEGKNGPKYYKKNTENSNSSTSRYRLKTKEEYARDSKTQVPQLKRYLRYDALDEVIMKTPFATKAKLSPEQKREEMVRRECFLDFLKGLFEVNPFERWTAHQAMAHPFITGADFTGPFVPVIDPKINERKLSFMLLMQRRGYVFCYTIVLSSFLVCDFSLSLTSLTTIPFSINHRHTHITFYYLAGTMDLI
jgi:serine/threonine protein kinase